MSKLTSNTNSKVSNNPTELLSNNLNKHIDKIQEATSMLNSRVSSQLMKVQTKFISTFNGFFDKNKDVSAVEFKDTPRFMTKEDGYIFESGLSYVVKTKDGLLFGMHEADGYGEMTGNAWTALFESPASELQMRGIQDSVFFMELMVNAIEKLEQLTNNLQDKVSDSYKKENLQKGNLSCEPINDDRYVSTAVADFKQELNTDEIELDWILSV